jgi:hypothetical protein
MKAVMSAGATKSLREIRVSLIREARKLNMCVNPNFATAIREAVRPMIADQPL